MPKPMLPIGGQPILAYNLAMLARGGFDDVVVNLHAFPQTVRDFVGDGSRWGLRVTFSEEPVLLGTAGALISGVPAFAEATFAVVFGDNLNELDLRAMLEFHRERSAAATIAVWSRDDVSHSGVAEMDARDRIMRFIEKSLARETPSHWVNAGVIMAEPRLLDYVPRDGPSDLGSDVLPRMIERGERVFGYRLEGGHWWFDRTSDYEAAQRDVQLARYTRRHQSIDSP